MGVELESVDLRYDDGDNIGLEGSVGSNLFGFFLFEYYFYMYFNKGILLTFIYGGVGIFLICGKYCECRA